MKPVPFPEAVPRKNPKLICTNKARRSTGEYCLRNASPIIKPPSPILKIAKAPSTLAHQDIQISDFHKLIKLRATSQAPKTLPLPPLDYQFVVCFISTWGNSSTISCSEIDFLTHEKISIPNIKVSFVDKSENTCNSLEDLQAISNRTLIKTPRQCWSHHWEQDRPPLMVLFTFSTAQAPEYIRIWNGKFNPESQLRKFQVYFDKKLLFTGEVPCQFGIVAPIKLDDNLRLSLYKFSGFFDEAPPLDTDKFGKMPVIPMKQLTIEFLETFVISTQIGLNSIQFFDTSGKEVPVSAIRTIKVLGATSLVSPFQLLKDKRRTMDEKEMWYADKENPNDVVSYVVTFNKPVQIILIRIWNYNGPDVDNGVKKARIISADKTIWIGLLNKAKGMTSKIVEGVTDIWLTEKELWKDSREIASVLTTRVTEEESQEVHNISKT